MLCDYCGSTEMENIYAIGCQKVDNRTGFLGLPSEVYYPTREWIGLRCSVCKTVQEGV